MSASILVLFTAVAILVTVQTTGRALPQDGGVAASAATAGSSFYARYLGVWDAEVEMLGQTSAGRETCSLACGGAWLVTEFHGEFMGQPYEGRGLNQFEAASQTHVGVWADSSGAPLTNMRGGSLSQDGNVLVSYADSFDMEGKPARCRYTTRFEGDDRRTFSCEIEVAAGRYEPQMSIRYTRSKK